MSQRIITGVEWGTSEPPWLTVWQIGGAGQWRSEFRNR